MSDLIKAFMGPKDGDVHWDGGVITRAYNGGSWHNVPAPLCFQLASALNEVQWLKDKLVEAEYKADNSARETNQLRSMIVGQEKLLRYAERQNEKLCALLEKSACYLSDFNANSEAREIRAALSGDKP
jgi:hypothetical protein